MEERLRRLEGEKQSLGLQVSVLSEQVEAQSEKIAELEFQIDDRDQRLMEAQDTIQNVSTCKDVGTLLFCDVLDFRSIIDVLFNFCLFTHLFIY